MCHLLKTTFFIVFAVFLGLTSCSGWKNIAKNNRGLPLYDYQGDAIDRWSLIRQDSLWGYVSEDGRRIVKPTFTWADDFSDQMGLVQHKTGYSFVNRQGKFLRRMNAPQAYPFSEGLAAVQKNGKWGYINNKGEWMVEPQFDWAFPFSDGRAGVAIGLKYGYINREGNSVVPPVYDEVHAFSNGVAKVRENLKYGLIDTLGNTLVPAHLHAIVPWEEGLYRLEASGKKLGIAGPDGRIILDTLYHEITLVRQQYIRAKREGTVGFFDLKGKTVIPPAYSFLGFVSDEGFIAAEMNGKWGFLDTNGRIALPFEYEESNTGFRGDRTWVKKDGKFQLMDKNFQVIKELSYDYAHYFNNGFAIIGNAGAGNYSGSLYGYVDHAGREVIPPKYHAVWPFNKYGLTIVGMRERGISRRFLINTAGELLPSGRTYYDLNYFGSRLIYNQSGAEFTFISPETGQEIPDVPYTALYPLKYSDRGDLATVREGSKSGLIDTALTELLPIRFDGIGEYIRDRLNVKKDNFWGFADERFRIRIPFAYDKVSSFRYTLSEVEKKGLKGAIDMKGRTVIPLKYADITIDYVSNRIYAKKADGYDMYDMAGRLLLESDFSYLGGYWGTNYVLFRQAEKLGAMDFDLQVLTEPRYDRVGSFYDGLAWVVDDGKGGFVNSQFQEVIPLELDYLENFALGFTKIRKGERDYYINTKGEEVFPSDEEIKEREAELQRRKDGFFEFSS